MDLVKTIIELDRKLFSLDRQCVFKLLCNHGIHPHQPALLQLLKEEACNQSELARRLDVSPAAVAVSIRRMEKNGLVARQTDPADLRSNLVSLTEKGRQIVEYAQCGMRSIYARKLEGFSQEEQLQLISFMQRISENLERYKTELEERI